MDAPHDNWYRLGEIILKIIGGILVVISFRWVAKIFKGSDGEFSVVEFGKFVGFFFFVIAGGYMLWKEGNRIHEWHLYSEFYVAIVFGALLTVLHLDTAFEHIGRILDKLIELRKTGKANKSNETI